MKKNFVIAAALVASVLSFSSCQEKMEDRVLTQTEQQDKIDNAFKSFCEANPASDFRTLLEEIYCFEDTYSSADFVGFKEANPYKEVFQIDSNAVRMVYNYSLLLSNLDGVIEFDKEEAVFTAKEGSAQTVVNFELDGVKYVATLKQLGKRAVTNLGTYLDQGEFISIQHDGWTEDTRWQKISNVNISVPEQISVEVTKGGKSYASAVFTPALNISEDGIDFRKDSALFGLNLKFNGYELILDETKVDFGNDAAAMTLRLLKNGQEILKLHLDAEFALLVEDIEGEADKTTFLPTKVKNINLSMALMDQVELRAHCANAFQIVSTLFNITNSAGVYFLDEINDSDQAMKDEWSRKVNFLNDLVSVKLYFTDNVAEQARMTFEPYFDLNVSYHDTKSSSENTATCAFIPMITYPDGAQLQMIEFATGLDFSPLVDYFFAWVDLLQDVFTEE